MIRLPKLGEYDAQPWEKPFAERLRSFYRIRAAGKQVAVLLYSAADTSTFRYRCYNVMQLLEQSSRWGAVYFFEAELERVAGLLDKTDLLVITRMKWSVELSMLAARAKSKGIPVLFDVDDMVFDLENIGIITNTLAVNLRSEEAYDFWFAYLARIQQAAALAQGYLTTNPYLGKKLSEKFGAPYQVIPNTLNREQLEVSRRVLEQKQAATDRSATFQIGYFSGTPSHINDFLVVYKELMALMERYEDISLIVVGFMEFPAEMQPLLQSGRVRFAPLVDFIELQRLIAQVDVNLVPLVNNSFTNCKSELKYFEAAVVDTVTVATPIYTYANSIRNGVNGFLCRPGEWYGTLERLYLKKEDTAAICRAAREDALMRYSGEAAVRQIEQAYDSFVRERT